MAISGLTKCVLVRAPRKPTSSITLLPANKQLSCPWFAKFSNTRKETAVPTRLSQAFANKNLLSFMRLYSIYGVIISPGRIPQPFASSSLEAPISINISFTSYGFVRASGVKTCGGFDPITP